MKFNFLELFFSFFLIVLIFASAPFIISLDVSFYIRVPTLCILATISFFLVYKRVRFFYYYLPFFIFYIFCLVYWLYVGNSLSLAMYYFFYMLLGVCTFIGVNRIKRVRFLIIKFYLILLFSLAIIAIMSFLFFNLDILNYQLEKIGDEEYYTYYYYPILGYVNLKYFEWGSIGRVAGYFFEPSYTAFFFTSNFFLISSYFKDKKKRLIARIIIFSAIISTFSTMSWVVLIVVYGIQGANLILAKLRLKQKTVNIFLIIGFISAILILPKDKIIESLGTSSADDREERAFVSLLLIANSSVPDLFFGRSPGYIERVFDKGESNQIIKNVIELGIVSTLLILIFIVYCTRKTKWYMLTVLIFLNGAVILFTPLIIVNLLVARWLEERNNLRLK